jgi:restriction endonuclease
VKLHFEPNLDYQLQAIESVCDLFRGQEICRTEFTVTQDGADTPPATNSPAPCASIFKISRTIPALATTKNLDDRPKKLPNESGSGLAGAKEMRGRVFTSAPHKLDSRGSAT